MYANNHDGVATVGCMQSIQIHTAVRIFLAVIGETLTVADSERMFYVEGVAYGEMENEERVVVRSGLHAIYIITAGPVLTSVPEIWCLRFADDLIFLKQIRGINRKRQGDDRVATMDRGERVVIRTRIVECTHDITFRPYVRCLVICLGCLVDEIGVKPIQMDGEYGVAAVRCQQCIRIDARLIVRFAVHQDRVTMTSGEEEFFVSLIPDVDTYDMCTVVAIVSEGRKDVITALGDIGQSAPGIRSLLAAYVDLVIHDMIGLMDEECQTVDTVTAVTAEHMTTIVARSGEQTQRIDGISIRVGPLMMPLIGCLLVGYMYCLMGSGDAIVQAEMQSDDRVAPVVGCDGVAIGSCLRDILQRYGVVVGSHPMTIKHHGVARTDIHIERCVVDESLDNI